LNKVCRRFNLNFQNQLIQIPKLNVFYFFIQGDSMSESVTGNTFNYYFSNLKDFIY